MTIKPWPAQMMWSDLPAVQRRKVMVHLGRLIRRCLADPQRTGSEEHGDDPLELSVQRENPASPS
jgi:hypothetical protein